jgi:ABC-type glycerol-3-phosphate transport system substrate-binding protein
MTPMNRRRFLQTGAAAATTAVTGGALTAPARATAAKAPAMQGATNLRVMVWGRPDTANWLYAAVEQAAPDVAGRLTVEPIVGGAGDQEVAEQFRLLLSAGGQDMPDIIRFNRTQVPEFASAGVLADLGEMIAPFQEEMIDSAVALASFEDRVVAIPAQLKSKVWYYRQDLLDEAGIDPATLTDIDAFVAAAKEFHAALPESYLYNMRAEIPGYQAQGILTSYSPVSFYDREAGSFQVTAHPGFRAFYETLTKLNDPELAAPVDDFSADWSPAFADGTLAASLIAEWMTGFLPLYAPDQAGLWRVQAWPTIGDSNQGSDAGGAVWVIPEQAPNKEAAFELLSTANLTTDGSIALLEVAGLTPYIRSAREQVPSLEAPPVDAENPIPWAPDFFGEDYFPVVFEAEERLTWIDFDPSAVRELALWQEWNERFIAGEIGIDETMEGLQADLESQIGDPWQV